MTIEEFARITQRIVERDGLDEYLPTAVYPKRRHVMVLEGAPETPDLEQIAIDWAGGNAESDEEFLVAFRCGPEAFKVVRCLGADLEGQVFQVSHQA